MTWVSALLPFLSGGVAGSLVSFGLSWARENRRSLDAYRTPQRQAIEDIVTATHAALLCELEARTELTEAIGQIRRDDMLTGQAFAKMVALGKATLDTERAFQIGSLTIVDPPCFEAMGVAYFALTRLRTAMKTAPEMHSPEEFDHYVAVIEALAAQLDNDVSALVRVANQQLVPAGKKKDRRLRDAARRRLSERFKEVPTSPCPPTTKTGSPNREVRPSSPHGSRRHRPRFHVARRPTPGCPSVASISCVSCIHGWNLGS